MALEFSFAIPAQLQGNSLRSDYSRALLRELGAVVHDLAQAVRERTPIATGLLRASIGEEVELGGGNFATGRIFVQDEAATYALYVEEGSRPHTPPIEPLKRWALLVLGDEQAAWRVRAKIRREGTRGHFMFRDTEAALGSSVEPRLQQASERAAATLNGRI